MVRRWTGVRAGELVHGLASEVLLGDLSGFGSGETTLHLTWATRRREPYIDRSVRLILVRWVAEAGEDVRFHREMFCIAHSSCRPGIRGLWRFKS